VALTTQERKVVKKYHLFQKTKYFLVVDGFDPRIHALYFCPQLYKNDDGERSQVVRDLGHRDPQVQGFSGGFSALPVRRKTFPLGQSLNTSQRLQSGLRA